MSHPILDTARNLLQINARLLQYSRQFFPSRNPHQPRCELPICQLFDEQYIEKENKLRYITLSDSKRKCYKNTEVAMNTSCERVVFSIVGKHAGEEISEILKRKLTDLAIVGQTFWMVSIDEKVASKINDLIAEGETHVLFLESSGKARPAVSEERAEGYIDIDGNENKFSSALSPVTGNINKYAYAFMLSDLTICAPKSYKIDTWFFEDQFLQTEESVKFTLGYSTVPCKKLQCPRHGMKSRERYVTGTAKIISCVKLF